MEIIRYRKHRHDDYHSHWRYPYTISIYCIYTYVSDIHKKNRGMNIHTPIKLYTVLPYLASHSFTITEQYKAIPNWTLRYHYFTLHDETSPCLTDTEHDHILRCLTVTLPNFTLSTSPYRY